MNSAKTKTRILEVVKWLLVICMIFLISLQVTSNRESDASFDNVTNAVLRAFDTSEVEIGDHQMVKRLYGIDPSDYDNLILYYPSTNMGAEELLLVKLEDISQQDTVRAAMEARIENQQSVFEGYAPQQYAMLENSIIDVQGNYLILIVADDPETVDQAFRKAL